MAPGLLAKLRNRYHLHVGGWASRRSGALSRGLRYPLPWLSPLRAGRLVLGRRAGLGDVLLCTPALREVRRLNPRCRVTFYTEFPEVLDGLDCVDEVRPYEERPADAFLLAVEGSLPPRRHLARVFGDSLGVEVRDVRPSCAVDPQRVRSWRRRLEGCPRPVVVVTRRASRQTPNKDWPDEAWVEVLGELVRTVTVVEVGFPDPTAGRVAHPHYLDLRGQTDTRDLVAVVAAGDVQLGPNSGPMHVAAAAGVPSVVVNGGYEDPAYSSYPGNADLAAPLPCSPCFLRGPCPIGRECLRQITPRAVLAAVGRLALVGERRGVSPPV